MTSSDLPKPLLRQLGPQLWRVSEPLEVVVQIPSWIMTVQVDEGFETDLGSVPRIAQNLFPATEFPVPYVIHDWLYAAEACTRRQADDVLFELLKRDGANKAQRNIIWGVCRRWGWVVWRRHGQDSINDARQRGKLTKIFV